MNCIFNTLQVDENFKDTLGDTLGPFIIKNGKHFDDVLEAFKRSQHVDTRPLWKRLKEDDKCDVLSILEKEVSSAKKLQSASSHYFPFCLTGNFIVTP